LKVAAVTLEAFLRQRADPDGLLSLSVYAEAERKFSVTHYEIERVLLENGLFPLRYQRQRALFGSLNQLRLLRARVAIVGCGGLGGSLLVMLVRLGVGRLLVIDPDFLVEHNLNRQLLATAETLGCSKVDTASAYAKAVNPAVQVEPLKDIFQSPEGRRRIAACDLVFDALDSIPARLELAELCSRSDLMLIHGAVAGWHGQMVPIEPGSEKMSQIYAGSSFADPDGRAYSEDDISSANLAPTVNAVAALQVAAGLKYLFENDSESSKTGCFINLEDLELELMR
jgi:molybdopterin/thiamine biosynthesis adenylyltransferase